MKIKPAKGGRNTLERKAQESYVLEESLNRFFAGTDSRVEQNPEDGDCSEVSFGKPG
jgi:ABC-type phosphonate transport system ATPase subunit